jgi:hypothetical protein
MREAIVERILGLPRRSLVEIGRPESTKLPFSVRRPAQPEAEMPRSDQTATIYSPESQAARRSIDFMRVAPYSEWVPDGHANYTVY